MKINLFKKIILLSIAFLFILGLSVSALEFESIERVSIASDGSEGNGWSSYPSISSDGRYITFHSGSTNFVAPDINGQNDIFLYDRDSDVIKMVSFNGVSQGDLQSSYPEISSDGNYVVFHSDATNLVPGDTNTASDVFVYDIGTGLLERISVDSVGLQSNGGSNNPSVSMGGRFVVFKSSANNLVPGDTNGIEDLFVYDRSTSTVERVSVDSVGSQSNGGSSSDISSISSDGRYVVFNSQATNLAPGDTNGAQDIFIRDRNLNTTKRISVSDGGVEGNDMSSYASISEDGKFVAFRSRATNLIPGDTNGSDDIFVYDMDK